MRKPTSTLRVRLDDPMTCSGESAAKKRLRLKLRDQGMHNKPIDFSQNAQIQYSTSWSVILYRTILENQIREYQVMNKVMKARNVRLHCEHDEAIERMKKLGLSKFFWSQMFFKKASCKWKRLKMK